MSEEERQAIVGLKAELTKLAAENLAMQFVLGCLMQRLGESYPAFRVPILQAFNDAADNAERFSIVAGRQAGHLPETLRIIEQMRLMFVGEDKPKREV